MKKGKLGFSVWLYPFLALWSVLMGNLVSTLLIVGFAIAVEKDEWCTKQCLHAVMFQIYWGVLDVVMSYFTAVPLAGYVFAVIDFIIWVVLLILVFIVGLGHLKRGEEIGLPGKGIVNRAYGVIQQYTQQQYMQPMTQSYVQPGAQSYTQSTPQQTTQQTPREMPQQTSQQSPQQMPQQTSQQIPQQTSQQMPQQTSQQMPQQTTQQSPQQTSQPIQQLSPQPTPQQTLQRSPQSEYQPLNQSIQETVQQTPQPVMQSDTHPQAQQIPDADEVRTKKIIRYNTMTGEPIYEE